MSYLLDSHVLLWWLADDPRIGMSARRTLAAPEVGVMVSAVSIWEIGIKGALGKLRAPESIIGLLDEEGFQGLDITLEHADAAALLPPLHRDPFDRMLIAQAQLAQLTLVTHDQVVAAYDVDVLMV